MNAQKLAEYIHYDCGMQDSLGTNDLNYNRPETWETLAQQILDKLFENSVEAYYTGEGGYDCDGNCLPHIKSSNARMEIMPHGPVRITPIVN